MPPPDPWHSRRGDGRAHPAPAAPAHRGAPRLPRPVVAPTPSGPHVSSPGRPATGLKCLAPGRRIAP